MAPEMPKLKLFLSFDPFLRQMQLYKLLLYEFSLIGFYYDLVIIGEDKRDNNVSFFRNPTFIRKSK